MTCQTEKLCEVKLTPVGYIGTIQCLRNLHYQVNTVKTSI